MLNREQEKQRREEAKKSLLGDLWEQAYRAHAHTSFSPEVRADNLILSYSEELTNDLKELGEKANNYESKYREYFQSWLSAKSRCISSMITGGSNFPVRRAQKANASESNNYAKFQDWRTRYFKAVNRKPRLSPEDEIEVSTRRLENLINLQIEVKEINKAIRATKLEGDKDKIKEITKILMDAEFTHDYIGLIRYRGGRYKIPSFILTNNNATIKREQQKIKNMEARIKHKENFKTIQFDGGRVEIENDRLNVYHDDKPEQETRTELKRNGFRWSPFMKCWTRKHTGNAMYSLKQLSFIPEQTKPAPKSIEVEEVETEHGTERVYIRPEQDTPEAMETAPEGQQQLSLF